MTESKVILPKEVAEAIEELRSKGFSDYGIIVDSKESSARKSLQRIHEFTHTYDAKGDGGERLLKALVNGYEVEQTPEDSLREYFETAERSRRIFRKEFEYTAADARYDAIITTLNKLGITIEGINDHTTKGCE